MSDQIDYARVQMLLDIVHNSIDVPGLELTRASAMEELRTMEAGLKAVKAEAVTTSPTTTPPYPAPTTTADGQGASSATSLRDKLQSNGV